MSVLWQYQLLNSVSDVYSTAFAVANPFETPLASLNFPNNTLFADVNIRFELDKKFIIQVDYDLLYNKGYLTNNFYLEFKGEF